MLRRLVARYRMHCKLGTAGTFGTCLAKAALKEVAAHSSCWAKNGPAPREGTRAVTTRGRRQAVHDLLGKGVGLLECSHRLDLGLNTVKRYARIDKPERLIRAPQYRPTLVDPFRDHLRKRRQADPAVPVWQLLAEITELGYTGSHNLLYRGCPGMRHDGFWRRHDLASVEDGHDAGRGCSIASG